VSLCPAEIHPLEHLGPVGRLGPARARADGEDRVAGVIRAAEEECRALALVVGADAIGLGVDLGGEVWIVRGELGELQEIRGAALESPPGRQLATEGVRIAQDLLRRARVIPEARVGRATLEVLERSLLRG
jgi:hypothetical protein